MILVDGGTIVNEGERFEGYVLVDGQRIFEVGRGAWQEGGDRRPETPGGRDVRITERLDARGMLVLPGVIDDHVHFREPGPTHKGNIRSESAAAAAGGVTSYMEMPNTVPQTTSLSELERKEELAAHGSTANYSFYFGAAGDNIKEISRLDPQHACGVKLFMGSSTGDMLVEGDCALSAVFDQSPVVVAAHCEDETVIRANAERFTAQYGDRTAAAAHPLIRTAEACYRSTARAVELACKYGADLHVLHLSTARELTLFDPRPTAEKRITAEVCLHHLWFSDEDYPRLGNLIKINPAIKSAADREALRLGLLEGRMDVVATDHAPHALDEKLRPYPSAPSGAPAVQHSLSAMLFLSQQGLWPVETVVEKMCHAPARRFAVKDRGFLRRGMFADMAVVDPSAHWTVSRENVLYRCGWSPLEGVELSHRVAYTLINGHIVNRMGVLDETFRGSRLEFSR